MTSKRKYAIVQFANPEDNSERNTAQSDNLHMGVWYLQNKDVLESSGMEEAPENEVDAVEIPKRYHDYPDICKSKSVELEKWRQYEAFEEVAVNEEQHIISTEGL